MMLVMVDGNLAQKIPLMKVCFVAMSVVGEGRVQYKCSRVLGWEIKLVVLACGFSDWTSQSAGPV